MSETNVFQLAQPGTLADSLTDVLREGARTLLAQAVEARRRRFSPATPIARPRMAVGGSCGMGIYPR